MPIEIIPLEFQNLMIPTANQLNRFFYIMEKSLKENKPVLIYCQLGCGRTGLLLTAYLMKFEGNIFQDAFKEIKQIKPCAIETHTQYEFLANLNIKL